MHKSERYSMLVTAPALKDLEKSLSSMFGRDKKSDCIIQELPQQTNLGSGQTFFPTRNVQKYHNQFFEVFCYPGPSPIKNISA